MSLTNAILEFRNALNEHDILIKDVSIELPFSARIKILSENAHVDSMRGRGDAFELYGVKINRLKSETDEKLRNELNGLEKRTAEIKQQLGLDK